jgi:hypothetical protein
LTITSWTSLNKPSTSANPASGSHFAGLHLFRSVPFDFAIVPLISIVNTLRFYEASKLDDGGNEPSLPNIGFLGGERQHFDVLAFFQIL